MKNIKESKFHAGIKNTRGRVTVNSNLNSTGVKAAK